MTTDPTARSSAPTPAPVAVPEDFTAPAAPVKGRCPACRRETLLLAADGYVTCSLESCPDPERVSHMLHAPRPEPVVAPLPSETLHRLAERGVGTDLTPTVAPSVDVGWWYEYLRSLDRRWREEVARIADRLVSKDDEDTVRVPRSAGSDEERETYSVTQIRKAFERHAGQDDWGVKAFYDVSLISALRGEYDEEPER